ncbi:hypothetical protein AA0111_g2145 [Alternaria arborescens]|uniref:hypothetical protein n=1 Tax=Alternaria arborescens TaxID=156630 RepID=UPI0010758829|nr:hypothetical protein AA0111_g2145 [Alternaria arborescens]RYO37466.1 hypothetical protein AA0111_g2145 [Alternaria arborescens]
MAEEQAREELMGTLKSLLESDEYSDFVITCGTDTYNVHKNVVCTRAGFFKGAEGFTAGQEGATAKADLSEDEPEIVKLLVQYLYEGEYDVTLTDMAHLALPVCCPDWASRTKGIVASQLLVSAKMYGIGDKYDVPGLKQLALAKFSFACEKYWESQQFAPAAHYAFSTTPESDKGLRDIVAKTIADHMKTLNSPVAEALLNEFNGLAMGVLKIRAKDLGWI